MSVAAVPAPDPFSVEALIAAIGVRPFAAQELRRVHGYQVQRAERLRAEIDRKLYRFVQRERPEPSDELPDFDYDQVAALLDAEELPQHVEAQIAAFDDGDTALAVRLRVQQMLAYLRAKLPRRVHNGLTGPEYSRPPEIEIARFARIWAVACAPMIVLDDLNEYALSRDQVQALNDLYPEIAAYMEPATKQALVRAKTVAPKFTLYRQKETLLRVLIRQEAPNVALGKAIQTIRAQEAAAQKAAAPAAGKRRDPDAAGSESTAGQRVEAS